MTPETRRRVLRYGIAIDLVILATGIGLLYPAGTPVLFSIYICRGRPGYLKAKCAGC